MQLQSIAILKAQQGINVDVELVRSKAKLTRIQGRMEALKVKSIAIRKEIDSCTASYHL